MVDCRSFFCDRQSIKKVKYCYFNTKNYIRRNLNQQFGLNQNIKIKLKNRITNKKRKDSQKRTCINKINNRRQENQSNI
jgi:hypothetical protein